MTFDKGAAAIDQFSIIDARRAGGFAGETGQAAIEVRDRARIRRAAAFEHGLHQIDAAARRIVLVAEQDVGRAGLRAEAIAHATANDAVCRRQCGICQLARSEAGLHRPSPSIQAASMSLVHGCGDNRRPLPSHALPGQSGAFSPVTHAGVPHPSDRGNCPCPCPQPGRRLHDGRAQKYATRPSPGTAAPNSYPPPPPMAKKWRYRAGRMRPASRAGSRISNTGRCNSGGVRCGIRRWRVQVAAIARA